MTVPYVRIFGAGVRAALAVELLQWQFSDRMRVEGYYEDRLESTGTGPGGFPILGTFADGLRDMPQLDRLALIAAGTRASIAGCKVFRRLHALGVRFASLVSPTAHVFPSVVLGENAIVFPGVYLGPQVQAGPMLCAHGACAVEHHSRLGENVLLGPGVSIAGRCTIEGHCFLGAGTSVIPQRRIGCGSLVGAGSVVVSDIPPHCIAYGRPAAVGRSVRAGDEVPTPDDIAALSQQEPTP